MYQDAEKISNRKITATLKQIVKQALEFPQLGVFKKQTSVRNDLGIVNPALEGTGSSTILFLPGFFFFSLNRRKKHFFKRENPVFFYTQSTRNTSCTFKTFYKSFLQSQVLTSVMP